MENHIFVNSISVRSSNGTDAISKYKDTLQIYALVLPDSASNRTVTWSVINGTGKASINSSGLLTAISNGNVTIKATANDGTGISGSLIVNISGQIVPITSINVKGANNATTINTNGGTLQMNAVILPSNATNKTVTWAVINGTGKASINSSGLLTAITNGNVTVKATAKDGTSISGSLIVTISGQIVPVTSIKVSGANNATTINTNGGTLQMNAAILPSNATNKTVTWAVINGTGQASINSSGFLKAITNGNVTVKATANDGTGISGSLIVTISGQIVPVTSINVYGANNATTINTNGGTLQMNVAIMPSNATNKTITWSVTNGTGQASINSSGLLKAITNGDVTVTALAADGSNITGICKVEISKQSFISDIHSIVKQNFIVIKADNKLILKSNTIPSSIDYYKIYSITGCLVRKEKVFTNPFEIDISSISAGIYIISFEEIHSIVAIKIIVP
ncbi:MAG: T9SS type A sorting domain-containing protein [Bacteroidales bacterium]|nr:T9SS type A sorting domain-containing protein [Bacteroidales bacterium]